MKLLTKILIFITIFLVPSYLIRFSIFGVPTNILEILIYLTTISFVLEKPDIKWRELYENYKIYIFSIILIFIGLIFSTLINQNFREGFGIIKGWFFDPILFSFVLINKVKNKNDIENILKLFYFSALIVSLIAFEYLFYGHLTYDGRLQAFYGSPNYLAMFLAPAIFVGLYLIKNLNSKTRIKKYVLTFTLVLISLIIYFTYSYAAWTAIISSLAIIALITKKISKKWVASLTLITIFLIASQFNNPKLNNFFSGQSSFASRMIIWKSSALMIKNNPIFGIGPGNFQNKYLEYQKYFPPYLEWAVPEPHNLYLAFWLESGIIGLISLISLISIWLKKITKNSSKNELSAAFLGIMAYILIHGMVDTTYWKNDLSLIFWLIFFLALISLKIDSVKPSAIPVNEK